MKKCRCKGCIGRNGFTLIELLVVVLIIGILAAIALPQYQKAVRKSRLAAVHTTLKTIQQGIDSYWLEHGSFPTYSEGMDNWNIPVPCTAMDKDYCYTEIGGWNWYRVSDDLPAICLYTWYHADGKLGNNWLDSNQICWGKKTPTGQWNLNGLSSVSSSNADVCRWWESIYGSDGIVDKAAELCDD